MECLPSATAGSAVVVFSFCERGPLPKTVTGGVWRCSNTARDAVGVLIARCCRRKVNGLASCH